MTTEKTIKYFSMFSGIGGFEHGIEKADTQTDFECVGYSEIDKYAVSIYEKHYPNHTNYGDATKINTRDLPNFSFLVGGFPCQAFSLAGKRKGFEDTRGTLFFEIARVLQEKRPRYFLLENVRGLLSHDKGKTFQVILGVLADLGYDVQWIVLNSKNYGVPQNRERIFIKGYFRAECGLEVLSIRRNCEEDNDRQQVNNNEDGLKLKQINNDVPRSFGDRIYSSDGLARTLCGDGGGLNDKTGLYSISKRHNKPKKVGNVYPNGHWSGDIYDPEYISPTVMGQRSDNVVRIKEETRHHKIKPIGSINNFQSGKIKKVGNVSPAGHHGEDIFSTNRISKTLCSTDYKRGVKIIEDSNTKKVENTSDLKIRRLTPVECERLQGFPDNWTKYGKDGELISDTQRYKCCGNAVTTNVIAAIIEEMFP